jgi:hypothetical protein
VIKNMIAEKLNDFGHFTAREIIVYNPEHNK